MKQHNQQPGKGALFQNDKKTGDKQPDYKGGFTADRDIKAGEWVKFAAWVKKPQVGNLISLAQDNFVPDPSYKKPMSEPVGQSTPREINPFRDDEVPF